MKRFDKIYIEITNICNLKCKFCKENNREKEFMKLEDFKTIISKIKDYTNLIALHVKGEPLLHPKLKEILDVCHENNILVNITTNATLLEEKLELLAYSKAVRQLNLSIHAINQNNLDINENMNSVLNSISKIKKINKSLIISYRLWNIKDLDSNDENAMMLNILGKKYNIEKIIERSRKEKFIKLSENIFLNQDIEFEWPDLNKEVISNKGKCYGLKKQLGILVNGDVVPCCLDQNGDILLGNILNEDIKDILESKKSRNIINEFNNGNLIEELCQRCGFVNTRLKKEN